jgi:hypothetical protein
MILGIEHIDSDCQTGKHRACPGWTWDDDTDSEVDCDCDCHARF